MTFITATTATEAPASPVFDYSSRDYASIYQDLLDRIPVYLPEWTSRSTNDFGIAMLQMFAYLGDLLSYYVDRLSAEAFMQTATQPASVLNLAALLDYAPTLATGATVSLQITVSPAAIGPIDIPAGSQFATVGSATQLPIVFQTLEDLTIAGANGATPSVVGTVDAVQGVTYTSEAVATSDGTVNQNYALLNSPVNANSFTVYVDLGTGPTAWLYVQNLIDAGPFDQVFTNFVDANGVFWLIFGDGVNGLVPPLGSPITCTYSVGVGSVGNVGAGTITQMMQGIVGVTGVTNPAGANGGTDPESIQSIQENAPASLKSLNRGVTVGDIETLAIQVNGVEWASVIEQTYQLVNLYICPFGGGQLTAAMLAAVQNFINPLVMANTTVSIFSPTYVPINVTIELHVYANFGNTSTQQSVLNALNTMLSLPETGFGFRVTQGLVYQNVLAVPGVNWAEVTTLNRQVWCTLTAPFVAGVEVLQLSVSQTPQDMAAGDTLIITTAAEEATPASVTCQVVTDTPAGSFQIPVTGFVPTNNFDIGSGVQDVSALADCVLLDNEIPVVGTLTVSPVTGGLAGS